ncbi:MAG: AAA family ATPase [Candidatus Methylarchaceae archaeon HK02M2]|nr:AAA family ATPase [Candidatus Methylarchaceae archaeon HK02M2]
MGVAKELEDAAGEYASKAIRLDSQGAHGMAIVMYQKSISTLIKLSKLYPEYKLNKLYLERARAYQERIKALHSTHGIIQDDSKEEIFRPGYSPISRQAPKIVESLKASYSDLVLKEKPNVKWDDVIGIDESKKALRESIIFPTQRPDLFPLGWPRGLLLFGPPGCGKTMLAAATASEIDSNFITIDAATIMSKWLGEAEKNVAKLFNSARKMTEGDKSVIIFIDELDSMLGSRSQEVGGEIRVRNQFLKEMDGIIDKGKRIHLYVIGATNKPWSLDWPFLRRFQKRIYVPLPSLKSRMEMLKLYTSPLKLNPEVNLRELAKMTEGYSGSDIRDICQAVQIRVVSELFDCGDACDESSQTREITQDDFKNILTMRRPSVSQDMLRAYVSWSDNFKAL